MLRPDIFGGHHEDSANIEDRILCQGKRVRKLQTYDNRIIRLNLESVDSHAAGIEIFTEVEYVEMPGRIASG